jgi:hypothetical protein
LKRRMDASKPASNGLLDVAVWCEFMRRNDLRGREPATLTLNCECAHVVGALHVRRCGRR